MVVSRGSKRRSSLQPPFEIYGGVREWLKRTVSKTVISKRYREFESPLLRRFTNTLIPVEYKVYMFALKFGYAILVLVGMIFWTAIFLFRKDLRKSMCQIGILYGLLSLTTAHLWWTVDWWHPLTITGTQIGIEDFFTGFGAGGVMMAIYQVFFNKELTFDQPKNSIQTRILFSVVILVSIHIMIRFVGLTSFTAFTLVMILTLSYMWIKRRDLIMPSIWSGILTALCILPVYWITIITVPGWVMATYDFKFLSGKLLTGIPIEELIFWFVAGAFIGILSAFTCSGKFISHQPKKV